MADFNSQTADWDDYGYTDLLNSIGTIIMGRKTYEEIIGFGVDWPYVGLDSFVVKTNRDLKIQSPHTYTLTVNLKDFVTELKNKTQTDIWLIGGGQLITTFLMKGF